MKINITCAFTSIYIYIDDDDDVDDDDESTETRRSEFTENANESLSINLYKAACIEGRSRKADDILLL